MQSFRHSVIAPPSAFLEAHKTRIGLVATTRQVDPALSTEVDRLLNQTPISTSEMFPYFLCGFSDNPVVSIKEEFTIPWAALAHYTSWIDDMDDDDCCIEKPRQVVLAALFQYAITRLSELVGKDKQMIMQQAFSEAIRGQMASFRAPSDVQTVIDSLQERNGIMTVAGCGLDTYFGSENDFFYQISSKCRLPLQLLDDIKDFWTDLKFGQTNLLTFFVQQYFGETNLGNLHREEILDCLVNDCTYEKALDLITTCLESVLSIDGVDPRSESARAIQSRLRRARTLRQEFEWARAIDRRSDRRDKIEELIEQTYEIAVAS